MLHGTFMSTCGELNLLEVTIQHSVPSIAPLLDLANAPDWTKIKSPFCPPQIGATP